MRTHVVRPSELGEPELRRWRELRGADPSLSNPFLAPEFTQGVARFRDDVRVGVVEDGAGVAAFFPFERHRGGVGHPVGFGLTDLQGIIADPAFDLPASELLRACGLGVWDFDHLIAAQRVFAPYHQVVRVEPIIDLAAGFPAWEAEARAMAPKTHKTIRYKERKLGREVGELSYDFASAEPDDLRLLMRWKSAQYQRTGRTDRFTRPWIVGLMRHFHETGFGVLSVLRAGGRPVSMHFGLRDGASMAGWFPAYDTEFARYSPGMIGHLRLAEGASGSGLDEIWMGRGGKEFKEWLKSREIPIAEGRVARPSAGAALHWVRHVPLNRLRDKALDNPKFYRQADRVLKGYAKLRGRSA
ncbi:CelD/BcsL family acetyltransferase involved in cellulose biosynthesis [Actinocorallia herbida]|uniref:CelD/BcsL family acetyltransferase involved in cellulose biosynthesis n=1 Tax=Actinocorallia herbida TaxID=58109 RepID=A0A3N1CRF5_9ACTN|nr:GNAT family N-acetyltransferase [Actinocorallia herbida]ROO83278.1 CelD/BcsL family acetyltransferase involved in cellulose biosynthesis [Actinocorallia herbida]